MTCRCLPNKGDISYMRSECHFDLILESCQRGKGGVCLNMIIEVFMLRQNC